MYGFRNSSAYSLGCIDAKCFLHPDVLEPLHDICVVLFYF